MTDTTHNFDPIPRLQQIAATIRERGGYTFDAPATAAYYIECSIKEIERLRKQHDVMMEFVRNVANDFNALSTRPRDAIRFGELVNTIQMWGDNANEILEDTNGS